MKCGFTKKETDDLKWSKRRVIKSKKRVKKSYLNVKRIYFY
jgi:hypothetical protein